MAPANSGASSSIPKWPIALGIGAAGALGLTLWYIKSSRKPQLKDTSEAISIDETVTEVPKELTPFEQAQSFKLEGNALYKKGKYDEAIAMYNKAIETCPEEHSKELAIYYQNRAAAYESLKKWSSVIADCTKAIELNSRYDKALMRRAKASENVKDWESCLDDVTCVCLLQKFQDQSSLLMADRVLKQLGKKHAQEALQSRKAVMPSSSFIKTYFSSFAEDIVYKKMTEVNEPLGQGDLTGFLKAKLAFASGKYNEVISSCTEEIEKSEAESPFKIEALSLRASFYFLTGLLDSALDDFTTIINSTYADVKIKVNALIKRASISMQSDKIEECLADFELAAYLGPDISDVYHHRGQIKLLMGKTNEATADFQKAVDLNPTFDLAYVQKCYADYRQAVETSDPGILMKCFAEFRKGLQRFPSCIEGYTLFAQVLAEKESYEEADELFQKALEIDSDNATVYVHRGLLLLQWKGEIDAAVNLLKDAIKIDDKCQFAYETLGTIEVQRGNLVVAIDLFNKAIALSRFEMELTHLFSLRDAATSQLKVTTRLGIDLQFMNASKA